MRRGLTFIEVVMSVAMLSVFAALVTGSIGFLTVNAERDKQRLQATELAHRVIVQYLDNKALVPKPDQYIPQGDTLYRVEIEETLLDLEESDIEGLSRGSSIDLSDVNVQDRVQSMHMLSVQVYKYEPANEQEAYTPVITLTRQYYPFLQDEDWIRSWILNLIAEQAGGGVPATGGDDAP